MNKMVSLCHIGVPMTETEKQETGYVWREKEREGGLREVKGEGSRPEYILSVRGK